MDIDLAALPDDVATLQRMVRSLAAERINLRPTEMKIRQILREFAVTTCSDYLFGSESELAGKEVVSCKIPASAEAANSASPRAS